jgi:glycosyltransferase involved in cell wall biosynthesis
LPLQQSFVKTLKQNNPQLNIIVISFQYPFKASRYNLYGAQVIALAGKGRGRLYRLFTWQRAFGELKKLNDKYELIGLLSFWMGECAYVGSRFAKKNSLRHCTWLLGQDAKAGNHYVNSIKPQPRNVIALSDFLAKEFRINYHINPQHVIPVGIDTGLFDTGTVERDIDIMGAGSLIPLKQYDLFVKVIKSLTAEFPDIKTIICGKGPEMEKLKEQVKKFGLEKNIQLKGELPHKEILRLMQRSRIFLHTSIYEGNAAVLSEALYAGAHVVSLVKPMEARQAQHHIPGNAEHLPDLLLNLLKDKNLMHDPVLVDTMESIAARVLDLFVDEGFTNTH